MGVITPITYSDIKTLKDESKLIPGCKYRITDYVTTTSLKNTKSAGNQFEIIVSQTVLVMIVRIMDLK